MEIIILLLLSWLIVGMRGVHVVDPNTKWSLGEEVCELETLNNLNFIESTLKSAESRNAKSGITGTNQIRGTESCEKQQAEDSVVFINRSGRMYDS